MVAVIQKTVRSRELCLVLASRSPAIREKIAVVIEDLLEKNIRFVVPEI